MATGYTAGVGDGTETTLSGFALKCARLLIHMRDESMSAELRPQEYDDHYLKLLKEARTELARMESMTETEAAVAADREWEENCTYWRTVNERSQQTRTRYETMLAKVRTWQPPTQEHVSLQRFMAEQLEDSIRFDCGAKPRPMPRRTSAGEWLTEKRKYAAEQVSYYAEQDEKERRECERNNQWINELCRSLGR